MRNRKLSADLLLRVSDDDVVNIARQLRIAYQLKRTLRYATKRDLETHSESVAEHKFAMLFLAEFFLPLEDPARRLNTLLVYRLILFHDFGEILRGDVPFFQKKRRHFLEETADAFNIFRIMLPQPMGARWHEWWFEQKVQESYEAKFVNALDRTEPVIEFFDPVNEPSIRRLNQTFEQTLAPVRTATEGYPVMRRFVEAILGDMRKRSVFCELPDNER